MAIDQTPGVIATLARDEIRDNFTRDYQLRVPAADIGTGTQPYVDASVAADALVPVYADAVTIGRGTNLSTSAGVWLETIGKDEEITKRPAVGASGFVSITTATGGAMIQKGTEIKSKVGSKRYECSTTALYTSDTPVPIDGIDVGPTTNLSAGAAMQWTSPPPGCNQNAVVTAQSDGSGLSGGRPADDDAALRQLISDKRANPPASGNDAEYEQKIRATPGLSVQQVFTIPAIRGPGTIAYCFTLNPARPGASRVPNAAQIAATLANVLGEEPADDSIFACDLVESGLRVCLKIGWGTGAPTWTDTAPWPPYVSGSPVRVASIPAPSLTRIRLFTGTSTDAPQVGQTIGFWDFLTGKFRRIRIGTISVVSAGFIWDVFPDRTNNASDPTFVPPPTSPASPWSDALDLVAPPVIAYFDGLGPGEQVAALPDPGLRQRRQPPSPAYWPSVVNNRILGPVLALGSATIADVQLLEPTPPYATPIGTPGVLSRLTVLGNLALFP